jgi:hypothetical protein
MRYAIVKNEKVINVAVSDSALGEDWVQSDTAQKGDDYDEVTRVFTKPILVIPLTEHKASMVQEVYDLYYSKLEEDFQLPDGNMVSVAKALTLLHQGKGRPKPIRNVPTRTGPISANAAAISAVDDLVDDRATALGDFATALQTLVINSADLAALDALDIYSNWP